MITKVMREHLKNGPCLIVEPCRAILKAESSPSDRDSLDSDTDSSGTDSDSDSDSDDSEDSRRRYCRRRSPPPSRRDRRRDDSRTPPRHDHVDSVSLPRPQSGPLRLLPRLHTSPP
ncbi:hypothetical protein LXA43DRAFT_456312 [Ganoderma leucocontextum]|nr:hypothetical protein LXA43DRAFT_456312 [Ganoderma leucocontextum]